MRSKVFKILLFIPIALLFIGLFGYIFLRSEAVQRFLIDKGTTFLEDAWGNNVSLGGIDLEPGRTIVLSNVFVSDQQQDTLLAANAIKVGVNGFNSLPGALHLRKVTLQNTTFKLQKLRSQDRDLNLQFIIDYFNAGSGGGGGLFTLTTDKIHLDNVRFAYIDSALATPVDRDFHENRLEFNHITGYLHEFSLVGDSLHFELDNFGFRERSGLELKSLNGIATVFNDGIYLYDYELVTANSVLNDSLEFHYKGYNNLGYFIDSVDIKARLNKSKISFRDLNFFTDELDGYKQELILSGNANGTVADLRVDKLAVEYGENGVLKGDVKMVGLPDWYSTFLTVDIDDFQGNTRDFSELLPPGVTLPEEIDRLGQIEYQGEFIGFYQDFVAFGTLKTSVGTVVSDLNLKWGQGENNRYSGQLDLTQVQLDKITLADEFGLVEGSFKLDGKGFEIENLNAEVDGVLEVFELNGYALNDVQIDGSFIQKLFSGNIACGDENLDFDFNGKIVLDQMEKPQYDFEAEIRQLNLKPLGFTERDYRFRGKVRSYLEGKDLDNLFGYAYFDELYFSDSIDQFTFNNFYLISGIAGGERDITIQSSIVDATIEGYYKLSEYKEISEEFLHAIFPEIYESDFHSDPPLVLDATVELKDPEFINWLLGEGTSIGAGNLKAKYAVEDKQLDMHGHFNSMGFSGYVLDGIDLDITKVPGQELNAKVIANKIYKEDSLLAGKVALNSTLGIDHLDYHFQTKDSLSPLGLDLEGKIAFNDSLTEIKIYNADIDLKNQHWGLQDTSTVVYTDGNFNIRSFKLGNNEQLLNAYGIYRTSGKTSIDTRLDHFDLSVFNPFLGNKVDYIGGRAHGFLELKSEGSAFVLGSDLRVENLVYGPDTLGDFSLITNSNNNPLVMDIWARMERGVLKNMEVEGKVDLTPNKENINLNLILDKAEIAIIEPYVEGLLSNISGTVSSELTLSGPFNNLKLLGKASLKDAQLTVDYINTTYTFSNTILFTEKEIYAGGFKLVDAEGNSAMGTARIKHELLDNIKMDLRIYNMNHLMCLNTSKKDNDMFYGKAYADGEFRLTGTPENVNLSIDATTQGPSLIKIPLTSTSENAKSGYIQFVDFSESQEDEDKAGTDLTGITMDFKLHLTDATDVWLIFNEQTGDIIKGSGNGNLRMDINTYGDFYMYGGYELVEGSYQFTALDFIKKEFILNKGSRLSWNGNPYDARIDIEATRRELANLSPLLGSYQEVDGDDDNGGNNYNQNVPVNCKLYLQGLLFSPDISFDITFPKQSGALNTSGISELESILSQIRQDKDELNRQVFSLLLLGTFVPTGSIVGKGVVTSGVSGTAQSGGTQFVSSIVNNYIAQVYPNLNLNIDWKSGTGEQQAQEIMVSMTRKFKRFEVDASVGRGQYYDYTPYNVNVQYNLTKDGRLKMTGFTRQANDPILGGLGTTNFNTNVNTTGLSLLYRKEFNYFFKPNKEKEVSSDSTGTQR